MSNGPRKPTIVIIGRPNVGKSTLFNRLVGKRLALVSDIPGLTRDRREGEAEFAGTRATIVDTAGLEDGSAGSISARMRKQTETAIASSDLVLFIVDARDGITPADTTFARLVRNSGKPTILIANKCEGRRGLDGLYETFELGLGDPIPVSAEHGEGIVDLELEIESALGITAQDEAHETDNTSKHSDDSETSEVSDTELRPIRLAIVGRPNAGKSTLVNVLLGEDRMITGPEPGLTRDSVASDLEWGNRKFQLFDTAGLRRKTRITTPEEQLSTADTLRALKFAEVVVLVIDAERGIEHQDLTIGDLITREGRAIVVALNKWDLIENKQKVLKDIRETFSERLSQAAGIGIVPISAVGESGIDKLMHAIVAAYAVWNKRVPTADLNRWLQEVLDRHPPPAVRGKRIRVRFVTQPSSRPPAFVAFSQRADALPPAYVRYLVNSLREAFDLPGTPIRFSFRKRDNPFAERKRRTKGS